MEIGMFHIADANAVDHAWARYGAYLNEILSHAGLPYRTVGPSDLSAELESISILILPTHLSLADEAANAIQRFVDSGNVLIGFGGTSGLDETFGCRSVAPVSEAWVRFAEEPIAGGTTGPLHAFGGHMVDPVDDAVRVLAEWLDPESWSDAAGWSDGRVGAAATVRRCGRGWALLIGPDAAHAVLRIQQGYAVHTDATGPADGSALVDDGILKTDDGIALDYERDRGGVGGAMAFDRPIADEWREVVVRAVLWAAKERGVVLPMLWYWPNALPAVGQISHDTDHNVPGAGRVLFDQMQRLGIPSTWCIQYPGGYDSAFYKELVQNGHEIALHFDARENLIHTQWGESHFLAQLEWLTDMSGQKIISNKNHYLRWEGLTEFFVWLERHGVASDQTKGGTKTGNRGFTFGGSHPWFPMEEHTRRMIDVLEVNLHTWELVHRDPLELGDVVVDHAVARGGVAHFLYHPGMIQHSSVAESLTHIVEYGRRRGLPWWTNEQIQTWERARRQVAFSRNLLDGKATWCVESQVQLEGATVCLIDPQRPGPYEVHGFAAHRCTIKLTPDGPQVIPGQ